MKQLGVGVAGVRSREAERIGNLALGALAVQPGLTAVELAEALTRAGLVLSKTELNAVLYGDETRFWRDDGTPPRWFVVGQQSATAAPVVDHGQSGSRTPISAPPASDLYLWQREALEAWASAGHRGVVEAVTGTGKTRVGMEALRQSVEIGAKAMVIVPTVELLRQWTEQLRTTFPDKRIGQLGGGQRTTWRTADIVVAVVNSARAADLGSPGPRAVLVADEVHRYGTESNAAALDDRFERRLGLSATYGRADDGNEVFLDPYFGDVCFRMDYRRAIEEDVTAHFKVALIGVRFTPSERDQYDEANRTAYDAQRWLVGHGYVREEPFGEFMKEVSALAEGEHGRATWKARAFLRSFAERRQILAETRAKRRYLQELVPAITAADRAIVFTQTVDSARAAADDLHRRRVRATSIHSQLSPDERREALAAFASGKVRAIAAPQVLDEGVDVPAADLAVILAASRSQRQMIQRMGRILRRKPDGRLARFAILYVEGTSEDPANGAHETFLNEVLDVADGVQAFRSTARPQDVCAYLSDFESTTISPRSRRAQARSKTPAPVASSAPSPAPDARATAAAAPATAVPAELPETERPTAARRPAARQIRRSMSAEEVALMMRLLERYRKRHGPSAYERHALELDRVLREAVLRNSVDQIQRAIDMSSDPRSIAALLEGLTDDEDLILARRRQVPAAKAEARKTGRVTPAGRASRRKQTDRKSTTTRRRTTAASLERPLYRGTPAGARYCPSCDRLEVSCQC